MTFFERIRALDAGDGDRRRRDAVESFSIAPTTVVRIVIRGMRRAGSPMARLQKTPI